MANTIKLKRASGSDPGASDLAAGELAIRTSNCALFSKNDSGSVVQINDLINDTSPQLGGNLDVQSSKITTATSNGNVQVEPNGTGVFEVRGAGGNDGTLQLNCSAQSHGIKLKSPAHSAGASYTLTFPDDVQNGKFLQTDTNGNLSWQSATNISNNNQLTNGAGYITATLTEEQVEDFVGGMVTGNTETGITVTYQDSDGTLDFVVATQTDNNFTDTLLSKLNGIAASATNVTNNNQLTNGAGYITSADGGNAATLGSIGPGQFMRDDQNQTATGLITLTTGLELGADAKCTAAVSSLSDGSTITVDFISGIHHSVTLGGNRTFGNPSNDGNAVGQSGSIFITQDGTGGREASFHSDYKFAGGTAPTLSTAANAVDRLDYVIKASGEIHCVVSLDVK